GGVSSAGGQGELFERKPAPHWIAGWAPVRAKNAGRTRQECAGARRITLPRPSLRGQRVIRNRRARADQVAVAIDVVHASDRTPVFVRPRGAGREAALGAAVGAGPGIAGDVVHGVRSVAERRGLDLEAAVLDFRDLLPDRDHCLAESVELGL